MSDIKNIQDLINLSQTNRYIHIKYDITPETEIPTWVTHVKFICNIKKLPKLHDGLKEIEYHGGELEELPILPCNLVKLIVDWNKLQKIPELPERLEFLNCSHNKLIKLPSLRKCKQLCVLECSHNNLREIPDLPLSLRRLHLHCNRISSLPIIFKEIEDLKVHGNYKLLRYEKLLKYGWCDVLCEGIIEKVIEYQTQEFKNQMDILFKSKDAKKLPKDIRNVIFDYVTCYPVKI